MSEQSRITIVPTEEFNHGTVLLKTYIHLPEPLSSGYPGLLGYNDVLIFSEYMGVTPEFAGVCRKREICGIADGNPENSVNVYDKNDPEGWEGHQQAVNRILKFYLERHSSIPSSFLR